MAAIDTKLREDPERVRAETLAWLHEAGERLAEFRKVNGHQPRTAAERALILPP